MENNVPFLFPQNISLYLFMCFDFIILSLKRKPATKEILCFYNTDSTFHP
jgi:hypothetical protein